MPGELFALGFVEIDVKLQLCRNSCQVVKKKKGAERCSRKEGKRQFLKAHWGRESVKTVDVYWGKESKGNERM